MEKYLGSVILTEGFGESRPKFDITDKNVYFNDGINRLTEVEYVERLFHSNNTHLIELGAKAFEQAREYAKDNFKK